MTASKRLADLQLDLQNYLLNKQGEPNGLTLETDRFSQKDRLNIYHSAYRLRLIDTLSNDFPALKKYVGDAQFIELASDYIAAHPSSHQSLRWFGEHFALFIQQHPDWSKKAEVAELAQFEWSQAMSFDSADLSLTGVDSLRQLAPEQWMSLKLVLHPSVNIMQFQTNAPELWQALTQDDMCPEVRQMQDAEHWLMWREDLQVVYRPLDTLEAIALTAFAQGNDFSAVCEELFDFLSADEVPMRAAQYLQHWMTSSLIVEINTTEN